MVSAARESFLRPIIPATNADDSPSLHCQKSLIKWSEYVWSYPDSAPQEYDAKQTYQQQPPPQVELQSSFESELNGNPYKPPSREAFTSLCEVIDPKKLDEAIINSTDKHIGAILETLKAGNYTPFPAKWICLMEEQQKTFMSMLPLLKRTC